MRNFFCGWRRKTGCVTLALACVFMIGWARSVTTFDALTIHIEDETSAGVVSADSFMAWGWGDDGIPSSAWRFPEWTSDAVEVHRPFPPDDNKMLWIFKRCGFGFFWIPRNYGIKEMVWIVPYWSIVFPLTLLSASLLLSPIKATEFLVESTSRDDQKNRSSGFT